MITSQLSLLNKYGKKITQKEIIVLTYAGLRGAIALCLSLMVAKNYIYE
jgi:NhaP-type Na+/H+ or K+/H+ antiporter